MFSFPAQQFIDAELEARVLSALAGAGQEKFFELVDLLPPAAFPAHREAYSSLLDAFTRDEPPPAVPGVELPSDFDLDEAARELAELARKRLVAETLARTWAELPAKPADDIFNDLREALARAEQSVGELEAGRLVFAADPGLAGEVLSWVAECRRAREETGRAVLYPPTGMPGLDRKLSGVAPGLWTLLGAPGTGKTFFALHLAVQFLRQKDTAVLFVSYEEPPQRLVLKAWCNYAGLKWDDYPAGYGDFAALQKAAHDFAPLGGRMAVLDATRGAGNITCAHIRAKAAAVKARTKAKHLMMVVDYLQLMANTAAGNAQDRAYQDAVRHRIGYVIAGLREISNRLNATVIAISAMNRASYKDAGSMAAARESSDVEYSADVMLRLQGAESGEKAEGDSKEVTGSSRERRVELHILKNRVTGQTGVVPLVVLTSKSRFGEVTEIDEAGEPNF